jgi:hypothetical protein
MPEPEGPPDAPEAPAPPEQPTPELTELERVKRERDGWRAHARKFEDSAKLNAKAAKELERAKREAMSEQERAIEEARSEARQQALREVGAQRVDDAVRVAAAGRGLDVDALLEGLDRTRFVGPDGQPDSSAVTAWIERITPPPAAAGQLPFPDLGQGARGGQAAASALNGDPLLGDLKLKLGIR